MHLLHLAGVLGSGNSIFQSILTSHQVREALAELLLCWAGWDWIISAGLDGSLPVPQAFCIFGRPR